MKNLIDTARSITNIRTFFSVARHVRHWAMRARNNDRWRYNSELECMCAICSYRIAKLLEQKNIKYRAVVTDHHVWIESKGLCIDVTATQFSNSFKPVTIMLEEDYHDELVNHYSCNTTEKYFMKANSLYKYLHSNWGDDQVPLKEY